MFDRFTKLAATTALALGIAGGASAQGLGSYDGPYAGLFIGYGSIGVEPDGGPGGGFAEGELEGFDFGGFVGYEFRQERMYYSGELEIGIGMKEDNNFEEGMAIGLNARVGYFLTDGTMVYGLVGLRGTEIEAVNGEDETVLGLRLGAGAEFRATDTISVRADYSYTIYEEARLGLATEHDISEHSFRVGGVYRFQL